MSELNTQYGIAAMVSRSMKFSGTTDKSEYPVFRNYINSKFSANGIQLVDRSDPVALEKWMVCTQLLYALKPTEMLRWTQDEIDLPANHVRVTEFNIRAGDCKLSPKNFKDWSLENSKMVAKKNMAAAFLTDSIPKESPARLIM